MSCEVAFTLIRQLDKYSRSKFLVRLRNLEWKFDSKNLKNDQISKQVQIIKRTVVGKKGENDAKKPSYMLRTDRAESISYNYKISEVFSAGSSVVDRHNKVPFVNDIAASVKRVLNQKGSANSQKSQVSVIEILGQNNLNIEIRSSSTSSIKQDDDPEVEILPFSKNKFFSPLWCEMKNNLLTH